VTVRHAKSTDIAEYYAVGAEKIVYVRVSNRYPAPPVCLTCRRNDCEHVQDVEDAISAGKVERAA